MSNLDGVPYYDSTLGDVAVPAAVAPLGTPPNGSFPSMRTSCIIGSPKLLSDVTSRDNIPAGLRAEGMIAFVQSTGLTYQLQGGILNANWVQLSLTASTLAQVLVAGNATGGTSIVVSSGDLVRGVDAATGTALTLRAGASSGAATAGANASLSGGAGTNGNATGGDLSLLAGAGAGAASGGNTQIRGGPGASGGTLIATGGTASAGAGGSANFNGGNGAGAGGTGGAAGVTGGSAGATGNGGAVALAGGSATEGNGGSITITAAAGATATAAARNGGSVTLTAGAGVSGGANGTINAASQLLVTTGSSGVPGIGFTGNTTTGFFQQSANRIAVSLGGGSTQEWTSAGTFLGSAVQVGWTASANPVGQGATDVGITRGGAVGVLVVNGGSTPTTVKQAVGGSVALTDAVATSVLTVNLAAGARAGGVLTYSIDVSDGTDFQVLTGQIAFAACDKAGTLTTSVDTTLQQQALALSSASTLTPIWTVLDGSNLFTLQLNADTSLAGATLTCRFNVDLFGAAISITIP